MKGKNKNGRTNWIGVVLVLVGMIVLVMAGAPDWIDGSSDVNYTTAEEAVYYHNFSANITGFANDIEFEILPSIGNPLFWTNEDETFNFTSKEEYEQQLGGWIIITNSSSGNLTINATYDNQTGFFEIPIQALNGTAGTIEKFEFIINATNDAPNFTLDSSYNTQVPTIGNTSLNISLVGSDEEEQYPLVYNVSFNNCSFASWSDRNNSDCSLGYDMFGSSNTTSIFALNNLTYNDVGSYNLTICTTDNVNGTSLPSHYDSDYTENKTTCYNTTLDLLSSLSIDASDCDGSSWTEGNTLSCTINITTIRANDSVSISAPASFKNDAGAPHDASWFYASQSVDAVDYMISLDISVPLGKEEVGNWTIVFSADDGSPTEEPRPVSENISIFVDYVESNVSLEAIGDLNGSNALYANYSFQINATDDDLLIWDDSVKDETFNFESNVSWVTVSDFSGADSTNNYWLSDVDVDHSYVLNNVSLGEGNFSVNISVTDGASNLDWKVFVIEIRNDTAPEWNASLSDPVVLELTEDEAFSYNVSMNVSDAEGDPISFYYVNESAPFCSLTAGNFNSNGMISFTPTDCDVGYHDVTIIASDGKLNSSYSFNFTVANVLDSPLIVSTLGTENATESQESQLSFQVDDFDYLIPDGQSSFYDEDLTIDLTITNLTNVVTPINFTFISLGLNGETELFQTNFTPDEENVGYYNVTVNVSDAGGLSNVTYFTLNITQVNDAPVLTSVENQTTTSKRVFYLDVNATDEEDDLVGKLLNYSLDNLTVGGDFLTIDLTTGVINATMNESLAGFYEYNLSVNDSDGAVDWQVFSLTVHGTPNITSPTDGYVFNWTEAIEEENMEFEVDYEINETDLTYSFYLDRIVYSNLTAYNYTNLSDELRNSTNYTWVDNANYTWNFTPNYTDETYGMLKNFTLVVSNAEFPELNTSVNWKVNVTHANENISFDGFISKKGPVTVGSVVSVDLSEYFSDADYLDKAINQRIDFDIVTKDGYTNNIEAASSISGWTLSLTSSVAVTEVISIVAIEYDSNNVSLGNASSNEFEVEFIPPEVVRIPTSGGGSTVKLKHFSLKLIMPQDIILSDQNYIEVPFSLQNTGGTDLIGINLRSEVLYNNAFSDDIKVLLEDTYIESLKIGQSENYTLKVYADTQRSGRYKVSIFANVTSPKFSDWGDFFIDLQKTNESEAEQILLFTEQLITDNPECLELTEVLSRAQEAFDLGDISTALNLAEEVTVACEDAILANEQIRYSVEGFVERNFYYISFATLAIFLVGLIFYIYKRVRFNKYEEDYNV